MFERIISHVCAYTHAENSRDSELIQLVSWIQEQSGSGLALVGHHVDSFTNSDGTNALVDGGVPYFSIRQLKSGRSRSESLQRVIALWPNSEMIADVEDNLSDLKALGVLTFSFKDIESWRVARQANDVLKLAPTSKLPELPIELLGALRSLTLRVNLSSGLSHPMDFDAALLTFKRLRDSRIHFDGDQIEIWAMSNGWASSDASELGALARDIASGKSRRLKARSEPYKAEILNHWREIGSE